MRSILNIGGGKIKPIPFPESKIQLYNDNMLLVNLDQMYFVSTPIETIIKDHEYSNTFIKSNINISHNCNLDIYNFLERYHYTFDGISMYRFLEHVPKTKILYFLYILSTVVKVGGYVDVIVPDCKLLANRILEEDVNSKNFEAEDIITTFELLNEPYCPHSSLWNLNRAKYFFELEKRFEIIEYKENYEFDGRNIYLRFLAKRIK